MSTEKSIFLHGMWRCGSTYVWSRFRDAAGTYCFYEPLHHGLRKLTTERITRDTPGRSDALNHTKMDLPYFHEFAPLVQGRGVRDHTARLAFDRYILRTDETYRDLRKYIQTLLSFARKQGNTPVLGCNRTIYRTAWMKKNFPSWNLHIDRHPFDVWSSYESFRNKGNYVFFTHWLLTIESNDRHPFFAPLAARLPLRSRWQRWLCKAKPFYRKRIDRMLRGETYFMVFYIWLGSLLHALTHADAIMDMDMVDDAYAARLVEKIRSETGLDVRFDGLSPVHYNADGVFDVDIAEIEAEALRAFPLDALADYYAADIVRARLSEVVPKKRAVIEALLA